MPGAIGHYLTNNGSGSVGSRASVLGEKIWNRVKYSAAITHSAAITPTIAQYTHQIESVPRRANYIVDIKRLRP